MRVSRAIGSLCLCAVSVAATIVVCELGARLIDGQPLLSLRLPRPEPGPIAPPKRLPVQWGGNPLPADVDPAWINVSPPPLANRRSVDPEDTRRARLARAANLGSFETFRIWNRRFVDEVGCKPGGLFRRLPQPILVFDPPQPSHFPPFRYPPSKTAPGGLVVNRFGWRGPEIPLDKPARTVRIAFVGASTTVGLYSLPFSYPEYVVHWLNLWAEHAGLALRFDGINAGREGLSSGAIAAVISQELPAAEPDLVVYYEAANQSLCVTRPEGAPPPPPGRDWDWVHRFVGAAGQHSQLARRLEFFAKGLEHRGGYEPPKPDVREEWPTPFDERHPSMSSTSLPPALQTILHDLESARVALEPTGAELAPSSFIWLVADGLRLDPRRHGVIYRHLNTRCWPHRYAALRRSVDLYNRALEQYASAHGLPFIDVASAFPPDPDLFWDSIHLNADGTRVHAWIVFQQLLPIVRARFASGVWPRPDRVPQSEHPAITKGQPLHVCEAET
jgi:GDSL-like Lipase/Acylhydrolase family